MKFLIFNYIIVLFPFFLSAQSTSRIEILNANSLEYDETTGKKAKKLIGDVQLRHENAFMFCDSAYVFSASNTMDAYGHVKIFQGDSLQLFGDLLKYNGNTRLINLRNNIHLTHNNVELITEYLDYDRNQNVAYYYDGGTMVSEKKDTLTSTKGYYYDQSESFFFKEDVVLKSIDYTIKADTLKFNSSSKIVYFLGPTNITSNNNFMYTQNGWYNTQLNISQFFSDSYIYSDGKKIEGDTLYYERDNGYGTIICNAKITDTLQNIIINGDLVHFFEQKDSAMVTNEALLMQLFDDDTLYLHADTLKLSTQYVKTTPLLKDTSIKDKIDTIRNLFAYNDVKFFKKDMQGKADSVVYNFSDSIVNFYTAPIIWSKENQLTADTISLQMSKGEIDAINMNKNAFIVSKADTLRDYFNQIKGENMKGYFKDKELHQIEVKRNSETIYYAKDDIGKYIGINKAHGENMLIFVKNRSLKSLTFIKDPSGTLYPLKEPSPKELILKGFQWQVEKRPSHFFDLFR